MATGCRPRLLGIRARRLFEPPASWSIFRRPVHTRRD